MYDRAIFNELIVAIIRGLLIPLIPVVSAYLIALIKKLTEDIYKEMNDMIFLKHVDIAENIINTVVAAVYQTYISSILKTRNVLTEDEIKIAFNMIKENTLKIVSDAAVNALRQKYTDVDKWIENRILCCVNSEILNNLSGPGPIGMEVIP